MCRAARWSRRSPRGRTPYVNGPDADSYWRETAPGVYTVAVLDPEQATALEAHERISEKYRHVFAALAKWRCDPEPCDCIRIRRLQVRCTPSIRCNVSRSRSSPRMMMAEDWSREEVEATVADYFEMLTKELGGVPFNKAEHNRELQPFLAQRSKAAIEFKHANISAVLIELGSPYVDGYKPRGNYQELLRDVVIDRLERDEVLRSAAEAAVTEPVTRAPERADWESSLVPPPASNVDRDRGYERLVPLAPVVRNVNYLEREARNASLGIAGEEHVMQLEHQRLWSSKARGLADRIEHVSRTRGDGLGFDILSYEPDGRERLIEVKTTRFGQMTPFFATRNEVGVSEQKGDHYHLYRLFKFDSEPKLFVLSGPLRRSVVLDPVVYRASLP